MARQPELPEEHLDVCQALVSVLSSWAWQCSLTDADGHLSPETFEGVWRLCDVLREHLAQCQQGLEALGEGRAA